MENKNDIQATNPKSSLNFIQNIIEEDLKNHKNADLVHTRFPPEPNGYLHIGHAKSICLNFGLAKYYNGLCNLRFDDTNPGAESEEYVESIKTDVKWLGFDWENRMYYASDYFQQLFEWAIYLIETDNAFVCELSAEEMSSSRGTPTVPGIESPFRNRTVNENLDLFHRMKAGEFPEGSKVLRAKIDMSSPNMHMRDPVIYRIMYKEHHRTGNSWCIYPMYDFAHGQSDSIEKITHSICTLEFEVHRPLYNWFLDKLNIHHPQQIEFARLNLSFTIMSKRKLLELVEGGFVSGWDDPRMPTISGLRRRGYTPESIRSFAEKVGVAKRDNIIDVALLEHCIREDLNKRAARAMVVLNPVKVIIDNYPEDLYDEIDAINNPEDETMGKRKVPFSKEIYIEKDDFMENPPKKYYRLSPGAEVRLRYGYYIKCEKVIKDSHSGEVLEIHCTYDPLTKGGSSPDGRKVMGTIHWVSVAKSVKVEIRLFDRLFLKENPDDVSEGEDFKSNLNPDSFKITTGYAEPYLLNADTVKRYQFERIGYFCLDKESSVEKLVFNRIVSLRDSWTKTQK